MIIQSVQELLNSDNVIKEFQGEYRWLSNFTLCNVEYEGVIYPSVENAYQAAKTLDLSERTQFIGLSSSDAKKQSKLLNIRKDWDNVRVSIMYQLLVQKFNQKPYKELLIGTGDKYIIEGNRWNDTFWGVCLKHHVGYNQLGLMIMAIRSILLNNMSNKTVT
jgi:ribA/ribD-fused uncharacterized protein